MATKAVKKDQDDPSEAAKREWRRWNREICAADKREENFRKDGVEYAKVAEGDKDADTPFNILFSNVETLMPALFNAVPRPVVKPRPKQVTPTQLAAGKLGEGILTYLLDDNGGESQTYFSAIKAAVRAALVPGRGVTWITWDPKIIQVPQKPEKSGDPEYKEEVGDSYICQEEVPWDEFRHGYAKVWKDVPWVARILHWNRAEAKRRVPDIADRLKYESTEEEKKDENSDEDTAIVYQIWDKRGRKVHYFNKDYADGLLLSDDDPYELDGFFPCPPPLRFVERLSNLTPVSPYIFYKEQAEELNIITVRIMKITRALRVRGGYDSTVGELKTILEAADNTMVPLTNVAALSSQGTTLDKAIWMMPIEKLVAVLQQLYVQRDQCKQTIYEITGMADIVRGASVASETATAQTLKDKWAGVKIKAPQATVQLYVRDTLRLMLELAVTKVDPQELRVMGGLALPTAQEKEVQLIQLQQQAQATGQPSPELQVLQETPTFDDALAVLQNDLQRKYTVDIETNSTVDAEATEDKQDIAEMLGALGQFLNAVGPLVAQGVLPFEAAQAMMLAISRRFRFGREVEDYIRAMQPPQQQGGPDPAMEKAKKELEALQAKLQEQQQALEFEKKAAAQEKQFALKEIQQQHAFNKREIEFMFKTGAASLTHQHEMANAKLGQQAELTNQKQAFTGQRLSEQKREVEGKQKQLASAAPAITPEQMLAALEQAFSKFAEQLVPAITQSVVQGVATIQRKAVRQKDGSWTTEFLPPQQPLQ